MYTVARSTQQLYMHALLSYENNFMLELKFCLVSWFDFTSNHFFHSQVVVVIDKKRQKTLTSEWMYAIFYVKP